MSTHLVDTLFYDLQTLIKNKLQFYKLGSTSYFLGT